jgi:ketosteroid isomerase-like protein
MASSSPNEALVRDLLARWNEGDREALLEVLGPETELHSRLGSLRGAPYRGVEGFREWFTDIDEQFSSFRVSMEEIREIGEDLVFASGQIDFRGRSSDLPWRQETGWVIHIHDGRLLRMEIFDHRDDALRAAGVEE